MPSAARNQPNRDVLRKAERLSRQLDDASRRGSARCAGHAQPALPTGSKDEVRAARREMLSGGEQEAVKPVSLFGACLVPGETHHTPRLHDGCLFWKPNRDARRGEGAAVRLLQTGALQGS